MRIPDRFRLRGDRGRPVLVALLELQWVRLRLQSRAELLSLAHHLGRAEAVEAAGAKTKAEIIDAALGEVVLTIRCDPWGDFEIRRWVVEQLQEAFPDVAVRAYLRRLAGEKPGWVDLGKRIIDELDPDEEDYSLGELLQLQEIDVSGFTLAELWDLAARMGKPEAAICRRKADVVDAMLGPEIALYLKCDGVSFQVRRGVFDLLCEEYSTVDVASYFRTTRFMDVDRFTAPNKIIADLNRLEHEAEVVARWAHLLSEETRRRFGVERRKAA